MSPESWKGVKERKQLKQTLPGTRLERLRAMLRQEHRKKDLEVKKSLRKDKREWANNIAQEAEDAAKCGQMKDAYDARGQVCHTGHNCNGTLGNTGLQKGREGKGETGSGKKGRGREGGRGGEGKRERHPRKPMASKGKGETGPLPSLPVPFEALGFQGYAARGQCWNSGPLNRSPPSRVWSQNEGKIGENLACVAYYQKGTI